MIITGEGVVKSSDRGSAPYFSGRLTMKRYDIDRLIASALDMDISVSPVIRYMIGGLVFVVATLVRFTVLPVEEGLPYITYFPATAFAALVLGTGPAIMVMVLSAATGHYVFVPPYWSWKPEFNHLIVIGIFIVSGVRICIVAHHRRRDRIALHEANQKLMLLSRSDGLTGAANKFRFNEAIEAEWARALRSKSSIGLLMIDIDYFKRYNDNYGHVMGDECLKNIVRAIKDVIRDPPDLVARFGGEEFVCLLPGADIAGTTAVGHRVLNEIRQRHLPHGYSDVADSVTVSIGGAAMVPEEGQAFVTLIEAADCLLYRAKNCGRDNISTECTLCNYPSCSHSGGRVLCRHMQLSGFLIAEHEQTVESEQAVESRVAEVCAK